MPRSLFVVLVYVVVGFAVVLSGAFLAHALIVMNKASGASPEVVARFGSGLGEIGIAIGVVIAALGILLVCIRYASGLTVAKREKAEGAARHER